MKITCSLIVPTRYNSRTGVFTVPDDSAGLYFFSTHLVTADKLNVYFAIVRENDILCGFYVDNRHLEEGNGSGSCSVTVELNSGLLQKSTILNTPK